MTNFASHSKTDKYDRQLRLWGANGQKALASCNICVLNAGPTATETLKNLVLPGCGNFTIVDSANVETEDLGNNFFVTSDDVGKSRAQVTCEWLCEMNPDTTGRAITEDPISLINSSPHFFEEFTLVIATQLSRHQLFKLSRFLWTKNIPLLIARTYGFIGYVRIVKPTHTILDTKPDAREHLLDLRIDTPFPELEECTASFQLDTLDNMTHRHVPFPILLLQLAKKWVEQGEAIPKSYSDKQRFRQFVQNASRGQWGEEENFMEAYKDAHKAFTGPDFSDLELTLKDARAISPTVNDGPFWVLVSALGQFMHKDGGNGRPPLSGVLPDLTSSTDSYITLQRAYRSRADLDVQKFKLIVRSIQSAIEMPKDDITDEMIEEFSRNAQFVRSIDYRSLDLEHKGISSSEVEGCILPEREDIIEELASAVQAQQHPLKWLLLVRAADDFHHLHKRWPYHKEDLQELFELAQREIARITLPSQHIWRDNEFNESHVDLLTKDGAEEILRFQASEPHSIAAFIGGIASQEAVKLITQQFVPINNTFIYNGITSEGTTMML